MALYWDWKNKCGEAIIHQTNPETGEEKDLTVSLYEGNAFLIFINEFKDGDRNMYSLYSFFADEAHAKNCLGLTKGETNIFLDDGFQYLKKIRFNKAKHSKAQKLLNLFTKAFDELEIELYKEVA